MVPGEGVIIWHGAKSEFLGLTGVGAEIWMQLEAPQSIESICSELEAQFDVDRDTCLTDVTNLIDQLTAMKLVVEMPSGA